MFQAVQTKSSGYTLLDKGDHWELDAPRGKVSGSMKQVMTYAVLNLGFEMVELELAVIEMNEHFHNAAEFGVLKRFMWTYDIEEKNEKSSGN